MRVEWRRAATADLRRIFHHIADENPTAARRVIRDVLLACESLALFPNRGTPGSASGTREFVVVRTYVVIYRVTADAVSILRVWHSAQDRP